MFGAKAKKYEKNWFSDGFDQNLIENIMRDAFTGKIFVSSNKYYDLERWTLFNSQFINLFMRMGRERVYQIQEHKAKENLPLRPICSMKKRKLCCGCWAPRQIRIQLFPYIIITMTTDFVFFSLRFRFFYLRFVSQFAVHCVRCNINTDTEPGMYGIVREWQFG